MRFPFRFMSLVAVAFGCWVAVEVWRRPPSDVIALWSALAASLLAVTFGAYGLLRSPVDRVQ
ncbi:MAG TPA: hypothetical protein VG015_06490 [Candidatus Dormibacteraeota bacterium]|jgi:hypothetical protein|nr:hypothetical protein [Candidatus Dormibacteraeota bacterium]